MRGAELLIRTAVASGIEVCFANPGTTELPVVMALDSTPGIRSVLGLFEGVCTGAADGYGRMLDKPAMTLLHLGPGFANGIANLHNARRAKSPVLNVIGEHATWHRDADPPLAMDIESLVRTVSGWWRTTKSAQDIPGDLAEALAAARLGQVATLIVPHDYQLAECDGYQIKAPGVPFDPIEPSFIEVAAKRLRTSRKVALLLGGERYENLVWMQQFVSRRRQDVIFSPQVFSDIWRGARGCRSWSESPIFRNRRLPCFRAMRSSYSPELRNR